MSAPLILPITLVAVPAAYWISRRQSASTIMLQRGGAVVAIWAAYLGNFYRDETKLYSAETMMLSVLVFILSLKLSHLILVPTMGFNNHNIKEEKNKMDKDDDNTIDEATKEAKMSLRDFAQFTGSIFYYALPISRLPEESSPPSAKAMFEFQIEYWLVIAGKLILVPVVDAVSLQLVAQHDPTTTTTTTTWDDNYTGDHLVARYISSWYYWKLMALFCCSSIMGTWMLDLQCALVNLLSAGRFEMLPFNNYPGWAISVGELWSKRYNLLIHALLKETVYVPLRTWKFSATTASLAAFAMSGILHSWVAYFTFGRGVLRAFAFFLVQVPWIAMEKAYATNLDKVPKPVRRIVTLTVFFASLPLYAGLFVESYPEWLAKNVPNTPKLPVLWQCSQWIMAELLHIDTQYWR